MLKHWAILNRPTGTTQILRYVTISLDLNQRSNFNSKLAKRNGGESILIRRHREALCWRVISREQQVRQQRV